jgi:hypothetical protein
MRLMAPHSTSAVIAFRSRVPLIAAMPSGRLFSWFLYRDTRVRSETHDAMGAPLISTRTAAMRSLSTVCVP